MAVKILYFCVMLCLLCGLYLCIGLVKAKTEIETIKNNGYLIIALLGAIFCNQCLLVAKA
jgi:hypothetical protein